MYANDSYAVRSPVPTGHKKNLKNYLNSPDNLDVGSDSNIPLTHLNSTKKDQKSLNIILRHDE